MCENCVNCYYDEEKETYCCNRFCGVEVDRVHDCEDAEV